MDINELFEKEADKIVGRILKRVDLYYNDLHVLKSSIKEVIYEELRDLRDLLIVLNLPGFKFNPQK
jgi:hypothetical protein